MVLRFQPLVHPCPPKVKQCCSVNLMLEYVLIWLLKYQATHVRVKTSVCKAIAKLLGLSSDSMEFDAVSPKVRKYLFHFIYGYTHKASIEQLLPNYPQFPCLFKLCKSATVLFACMQSPLKWLCVIMYRVPTHIVHPTVYRVPTAHSTFHFVQSAYGT